MRYTYYFSNEVTPETIEPLFNALYTYPEIDVYFSTNGGQVSAMSALIRDFNSHENLNIFLVDNLSSCGTQLLTDYVGRLHITKNLDYILIHPIKREPFKHPADSLTLKKQLDEGNENLAESFRSILTEEELSHLREGGEVFLYRKDFERLKKDNVFIE